MTTDTTTAVLERRVARLERRCLILAMAAPVAIVAAALVGMAGDADEPEPIRATSFELVDGEGQVRAALRMEGGGPGLHLMDEAGHARLSAWHDADQTAIYLRNEKEEVRVGTALFAHGGAGYALHGPEGKGAAVLYMTANASPRLTFYGVDGAVTYNTAPAAK